MGPAAPGSPSLVMILVRLAVDLGHKGAEIGAALKKDALLRTVQATDLTTGWFSGRYLLPHQYISRFGARRPRNRVVPQSPLNK
jgi:hypothetical protein